MNFQKHIEHSPEFVNQELDVKGDQIKRGDIILVTGKGQFPARRQVTRVVVKVKNVEVYHMQVGFVGYDPNHPMVTFRVDTTYIVLRPRETEQSKARSLRAMTLESLWRRAQAAQDARLTAKAKFDAQFANGHTGHWEYEQVLVTDLKGQVLKTWVDHVEQIAERIESGESWEKQPADALEVAENMAKRFQRDILRNATRPLSRSTAVLGNIVEDVIDAAKADFIEYATGHDIWG